MLTNLDLSSEIARNKHFPVVDIVKFICSFLVISIHVSPFIDINEYLAYGLKNYVARLAVPFFFVAGGYFCFRKTNSKNIDCKIPISYAKRMIKLYLIWTAIYLPLIIYNLLKDEGGILQGILLEIRDFIFVGSFTHLWYLLASAIATLIICFLIKNFSKRTVALVCTALYIIGLFGTSYLNLLRPLENIQPIWFLLKIYKLVFAKTRNGFFFGSVFVGMGAFFAYKKINLRQSTAIIGFMLSMFFMFVEAFCLKYFNVASTCDMYVFLIPTVFFLFYIATHIEMKETAIIVALRKYSSIIYFVHLWVNFCVEVIIKIFGLLLDMEAVINSLLQYTIVAIGSLIMAVIVVELQKHKSFGWLKNSTSNN